MNLQLISHSENETKKIAKKIASCLSNGNTIVLTGDLGSGKTKFVEGFLSYYGLENEISSPTFTIVNEYNTSNVNIYHFDVYRLESEDEFYAIGGDEYFSKGICIIEWGELIKNCLPNSYINISFEKDPSDTEIRILNISIQGNENKFNFLKKGFF